MNTLLNRRELTGSAAAAIALAGLSVWGTQRTTIRSSDLPVVTSTVGMITSVASAIGGDDIAINGLMGPGIDPHLYKPTAGDIQRLGDADLILYGGLHLEGRMIDTFDSIHESGAVRAIAVSESIPEDRRLRSGDNPDDWDPHVWFDVSLWTIVAETIAQELVGIAPGHEQALRERADAYITRLMELDTWVEMEIARIPAEIRILVTAHDAFHYFGHRYDIEVTGLQGLSTATEAGAGDVQILADMLAERRIPAIFVESSIPPSTIEAVQAATRARGWDVRIGGQLYSDAMGQAGTPDGTYIGMVRHNVTTIVEGLLGEHALEGATNA